MLRLALSALVLASALLGAPAKSNDLQREDVVINARERMECRREALNGAAERIRKRMQSKRGERNSRPPRSVPQRPPVGRPTR